MSGRGADGDVGLDQCEGHVEIASEKGDSVWKGIQNQITKCQYQAYERNRNYYELSQYQQTRNTKLQY